MDNNNLENLEAVRPAIVSGAEDSSVTPHEEEETSVGSDDDANLPLNHPDEFYGENIDEENEAWVYKHMRGGVQETVSAVKQQNTSQQEKGNSKTNNVQQPQEVPKQDLKVLRPRNSDAVLSCPCCFNIVCMDCQQHERYENQYRAMFVMNIGVCWNQPYVYSEQQKKLLPKTITTTRDTEGTREQQQPRIVDPLPNNQQQDELYYSVYCNNCQTQVAALNMQDEVYHFFGCLASA